MTTNRRSRTEGIWVNPLIGVVDKSLRKVFDSLRGAGWVDVPDGDLQNSWTSQVGGYAPCGYRMDPWGRVHLRGKLNPGTLQDAFTLLFTLPTGVLPKYRSSHPLYASDGTTAGNEMARCDVLTDGQVGVYGLASGSIGFTVAEITLDGISFDVVE